MLSNLIKSAPEEFQLIEVIGRIDSDNANALRDIASEAMRRQRTHLILDLHAVDYINSAGLRTLVQFYKLLKRRGGTLSIVNPSDNVIRLLNLVGLDSIFEIYFDAQWNTTAASSPHLPAGSREVYYCM